MELKPGLTLTLIDPNRRPTALGVNVALTVQLAPAASVTPVQVSVSVKSPNDVMA